MWSRLAFAFRRAVFSQPLGMTLAALAHSFERRRPVTTTTLEHPIDRRYGTDTGGVISATTLRTGAAADIHNFGYVSSQPSIVRTALQTIPDLADAVFVDMGCGKGRVLVVASEHPFRRIVGVELSPELCRIARANAARVAAQYPGRTPIEVVESDVLGFELPPGKLVIYIYNSFFPRMMKAVAEKIAHRISAEPMFVVYYNPASAMAFDRQSELSRYLAGCFDCDDEEAGFSSWRTDSVIIWQGGAQRLAPLEGASAPVRVTAGGAGGEVMRGDRG
jgi:hypothetical protein